MSPDDLRALSIGEAVVTYGGKHIFNVRVPRIEVTEEARRRFGPVMITRKRPNHAERRKGAQFFENAERYLHATGRNPYLMRKRLAESKGRFDAQLGGSVHWSRLL